MTIARNGQSLEAHTVETRPNILIIMTDDQRADRDSLSVMDSTRRIFGKGSYYPNAVATTPLCCPSRASVFTGKYVHNHKVTTQNNAANMPQEWTMQYHLKSLGYTTALVGKYLNNWSGPKPYFDYVKGGVFTNYYDGSRKYTTHVIRNNALSLLNTFESKDAKPWLMYVYPFAPHDPAIPEKAYETAAVPEWRETPARAETNLRDKPAFVQNKAVKTSKPAVRTLRKRMLRTLLSVDDMNRAIFQRLGHLGESNTLAFFLSDNGYLWYEHKLSEKQLPYDDSIQVPFFARWPGHIPAGKDPRIVANIDIAPTVYDALGYVPSSYTPDGKSLFSSDRDHILTEFRASNPWYALWHPDWTYVQYDVGFKEFYGPEDPWQLNNSFKGGTPPDNASRLAALLSAAKSCSGVSCP